MIRNATLVLLLTISAGGKPSALTPQDWKQQIESARPNTVVSLPAGVIQLGSVTVPRGVILRGAGAERTTLSAGASGNGISLSTGSTLSDLTIRDARETGVRVQNGDNVTISRIRVVGCLTGLVIDNSARCRIESSAIVKNRTGVSLIGARDSGVVNCSLVDNSAVALTVAGANRVAVFNNLLVNTPTAVYFARNNTALSLDYNLYVANYFGKLEGEAARTTLFSWRRISGQDAHSVALAISFVDPANDNYRPATRLPWAPFTSTAAGWAVPALGGSAAPAVDITGTRRSVCLGAYETPGLATRPPDGAFSIASDDGLKSAGIYTRDGVRLVTLFQNVPLHRGRHPFWLPSRDDRNRPLPAGEYQLRLVESHLGNRYIGLAGNFGRSSNRLDNCSWAEEMFAFDDRDRLYIAQNSFENGMGVRAFDAEYRTPRWMMPGGGGTVGVATDARWIYYLQQQAPARYILRRIDLDTGALGTFGSGAKQSGSRILSSPFSANVRGMTQIGGRLYISDAGSGVVYAAATDDPVFEPAFRANQPASVTADAKTGLIWCIGANNVLVVYDPRTRKSDTIPSPVPSPTVIAACNGRLALLSRAAGKIFRFYCSDPTHLRAIDAIGTGDGPNGPLRPDRFWFQTGKPDDAAAKTHLAINSKGDIAVVDDTRVSFWSADGSLKRQGMGFWGQHVMTGRLARDTDVRIWSYHGDYSIKVDSKGQRWEPDTRWELPAYQFEDRAPHLYFNAGGHSFGVYGVILGDPGKTPDRQLKRNGFAEGARTDGLLVLRMDAARTTPVSLYFQDSGRNCLMEAHDTNHDGIIDARDTAAEVRDAMGNAVSFIHARYGAIPYGDGGDIAFTEGGGPGTTGVVIPMLGIDPTGSFPVYGWNAPRKLLCAAEEQTGFTSPYDYKTREEASRSVQVAPLSDGGYASSIGLRTSGGTGLANGAGTDLAGFGKDGRLRWLFQLSSVQGSEGVQTLPGLGLVFGMTTTQCDYMVTDEDGLGMGALSMSPESHWGGMWSDHAQQQQVWIGNDGQPYYLLGDYSVNGLHWYAITGAERTVRSRTPITIDGPKAMLLARLPGRTPEKPAQPPTVRVTVRRLAKPMPIDGDLKKWHDAGIAPTTLITPETGTPDIIGPQDCSAVVRLAYFGQDLYVQTVVFDDKVTFHQPQSQMNLEDGVEFIINSFMEGFKYNIAITTDQGPTIYRNRFVSKQFDRVFTSEQAPRAIRVLDSATDVEDRKYIESLYGVDLSKSKVIVTEFKLPLTAAVALDGAPDVLPTVASGKSFWIGFLINDNDIPGGDIQKYLVWPATYGNFNIKEAGALATFE